MEDADSPVIVTALSQIIAAIELSNNILGSKITTKLQIQASQEGHVPLVRGPDITFAIFSDYCSYLVWVVHLDHSCPCPSFI